MAIGIRDNGKEEFMCPFHRSQTDKGWCWSCAEEIYGYEDAKIIYDEMKRSE